MIKYLHLDYWISEKPTSKEKSTKWCQKGLFALYRHQYELSSAILRKLLTIFEKENDQKTTKILQNRLRLTAAIHGKTLPTDYFFPSTGLNSGKSDFLLGFLLINCHLTTKITDFMDRIKCLQWGRIPRASSFFAQDLLFSDSELESGSKEQEKPRNCSY